MIINIDGGNGGGGGGYVLPIASASVLGGVKVGSGLTIDNAGRLSTSGGSAAEAFRVEISNAQPENWTADDYAALSGMVEYLSDKLETGAEAYIDVVIADGDSVEERLTFVLTDFNLLGADFTYSYAGGAESLHLDFGDLSASEWQYFNIPTENYTIVDVLSAITEPTEGLMASVRSYSSETTTNKIYISDIEAFSSEHGGIEGYLGHFLYTGSTPSDPNQSALYISGDQLYWDLENDGQWHTRTYDFDGSPVSIKYRTHNEPDGHAWFEYAPVTENVTFSCENNVAETALTYADWTFGKSYIYRAGEWVENGNVVVFKWNDIAPSTSAETAALRTMFSDMVDRGVIPSILRDNHVFNYSGSNSQWVNFEAVFGYNADWVLYISGEKVEEDGFDNVGVRLDQNQFVSTDHNQHTISLTSGGTFSDPDQLGKFPEESHTDIIIFKIDGDYGSWSQAPIKYVYRTRSQDEDPFVYHFAVEIPVNGTLYRGVWHATEGDWSNYTTDTWAAV